MMHFITKTSYALLVGHLLDAQIEQNSQKSLYKGLVLSWLAQKWKTKRVHKNQERVATIKSIHLGRSSSKKVHVQIRSTPNLLHFMLLIGARLCDHHYARTQTYPRTDALQGTIRLVLLKAASHSRVWLQPNAWCSLVLPCDLSRRTKQTGAIYWLPPEHLQFVYLSPFFFVIFFVGLLLTMSYKQLFLVDSMQA